MAADEEPAINENPYRSPDASPPAAVEMPDHKDKRSNTGCLVLFLLALPLLDAFGMFISNTGPYGPVMIALGLCGFACGAGLGAYVSVKMQQP
jgi:hypothetical protein